MRIIKTAFVIVLAAQLFQMEGRQPDPPDSAVFRVGTTLVQVDAVVTDSKGHQVTGLSAADFELYADGKLQTITHFSYVTVAPPGTLRGPTRATAKDPATAPPPIENMRPDDVRRTIVLMVDDLNLSFESLAFVRASLLKFVDQQMQPGDLIAVCRTGAGSSALQQFTSDRRVARSVISSLKWNPNGSGGATFLEPVTQDSDTRSPIELARSSTLGEDVPVFNGVSVPSPRSSQQLDSLRRNTLSAGALGAIDYMVQALRSMPGRKSVVLLSDGFTLDSRDDRVVASLRHLVDRANRSGTVIYTIHAAGLLSLQPDASDNPRLANVEAHQGHIDPQAVLSNLASRRSEQLYLSQAGLDYLAGVTGGIAYRNGNDLNWDLARMLEDQRGYYLLGYSPPSGTFDEKKGERPYHYLRVVLKTKGLTVRSRSGFFGATDEEIKPPSDNALEQMRNAMLSPFTSAGIGLRLTPIYAEVAGHGAVVRNLLDIDTHGLTFTPLPDGSSVAKIKLLVAAFGADNTPISAFDDDYKITVAAGKMEEALRIGALLVREIPLPKPGGVQIRAAVRDSASLKTGSAHEFLQVPDVRKKQLALTSVVLAEGSALGSGTLGSSAARRQFQRGTLLQYFCLLENADAKHAPATDLSAQVRIVADGRQMFLGPVKITEMADHKRAIIGQMKLGAALAPGDYYLQVIAKRSGGPKADVADQWSDFEVLP